MYIACANLAVPNVQIFDVVNGSRQTLQTSSCDSVSVQVEIEHLKMTQDSRLKKGFFRNLRNYKYFVTNYRQACSALGQ